MRRRQSSFFAAGSGTAAFVRANLAAAGLRSSAAGADAGSTAGDVPAAQEDYASRLKEWEKGRPFGVSAVSFFCLLPERFASFACGVS